MSLALSTALFAITTLLNVVAAPDDQFDAQCRGIVCDGGFRCFRGFCLREQLIPTQPADNASVFPASTAPPPPPSDGCADVKCPGGFVCYNAVCFEAECPRNRVLVAGNCLPKRSIGDRCASALECPQKALCKEGRCVCPQGNAWIAGACQESPLCAPFQSLRVGDDGDVRCLDLVGLNQPCGGASAECSGNLRCTDGKCECFLRIVDGVCIPDDSCDANKILHAGMCLSPDRRPCASDSDCAEGQSCDEADLRCKSPPEVICRPDEIAVDRRCFRRALLGEFCRYDEQCVEALCIEGRCACAVEDVEVDGRCAKNGGFCWEVNTVFWLGECLPRVSLNESCKASSQCPRRSACFAGMCKCPTGTLVDGDGCVESANSSCCGPKANLSLGQKCSESSQCIASLACLEDICQCPFGGLFDGAECISQSPPPQKDSECPKGRILFQNRCLPLLPPGNACEHSEQCVDGANCTNRVCTCSGGTYRGYCMPSSQCDRCQINQVLANGECLDAIAPEHPGCSEGVQCLGGSLCDRLGYCRCAQGSESWLGYCISDGKTKVRQCKDREVLIQGMCFAPQMVGGPCVVSGQCPPSASCSASNRCECDYGSVLADGSCPRTASSSPNLCRSYQIALDNHCLDTVPVGGDCERSEQCVNGNATCSPQSRRCVCPEGMEFDGKKCFQSSMTKCPPGSVVVGGMCYSIVALNQFCQFDAQCAGFATCVRYSCVCSEGKINVNGYCRHLQW